MTRCRLCDCLALAHGLCNHHLHLALVWGVNVEEALTYVAWVYGGRKGDWRGLSHIGMMTLSARPLPDDRIGWQAQLEDLCYFLRVRL